MVTKHLPAGLIAIICCLVFAIVAPAEEAEEKEVLVAISEASPVQPNAALRFVEPARSPVADVTAKKPPYFRRDRSGTHIGEKGKGRFRAKINVRSQLRFDQPFKSAPRKASHFTREGDRETYFRRARFKAQGHLYAPWISYKFEHDLVSNRDLDARITIKKFEWLQFRFGEWKVDYSRERMDSSGNQQFADRSIVNRAFTLDRQKGVTVLGRLAKGTRFDSWYYVGAFTGNGRGWIDRDGLDNSDGSPLVMARYQWNFLGRDVGHSQSDIEYSEKPVAAIAVGTARNRSRFTRFSSSGGGNLDGFELGENGQYSLRQFMEETTVKYRGLAIQHELHWKRIKDNLNSGRMTYMRGAYVQAGYFFHYMFPKIPKQLELGGRYAFVDPDRTLDENMQKEFAAVVNWYFYGHGNKLTFDTSRFKLGRDLHDTQVRLQWDVSF